MWTAALIILLGVGASATDDFRVRFDVVTTKGEESFTVRHATLPSYTILPLSTTCLFLSDPSLCHFRSR